MNILLFYEFPQKQISNQTRPGVLNLVMGLIILKIIQKLKINPITTTNNRQKWLDNGL